MITFYVMCMSLRLVFFSFREYSCFVVVNGLEENRKEEKNKNQEINKEATEDFQARKAAWTRGIAMGRLEF